MEKAPPADVESKFLFLTLNNTKAKTWVCQYSLSQVWNYIFETSQPLLIFNCDTPYVLLEDSGESPEIETKWGK